VARLNRLNSTDMSPLRDSLMTTREGLLDEQLTAPRQAPASISVAEKGSKR
jgi:hypothetical protein